jgi:DNA-binding transcriptional LysR family regulator
MSRIGLQRLRYFVAVAEELNFGRAAQRLNMAQPPLSQQIAKLEEEVGVQLLYRTKRRVELTIAGALFLKEARATLTQAAHAVDVARRAARGEIGEISIGYAASADLTVLPALIPRFRDLRPDVRLSFRSDFQIGQLAGLRNGTIDVGFLHLPLTEVEDLDVVPILREPLVALLPGGHRLATRQSIEVAELGSDRYIIFARGLSPGYFDSIVRALCEAQIDPEMMEIADPIQFNLSLVAMGEGVSMHAASICKLSREGVAYVPIEPSPFMTSMGMISRKGDRSEALRKFRETAADVFGCALPTPVDE